MQLFICEPYPAAVACYEVREIVGSVRERHAQFLPGCVDDWSLLDTTSDFATATAMAREHCIARGVEVWVVDCNDGNFVALRVTPEEYSRKRQAVMAS